MRNDLGGLGGPQTVPEARRSRRTAWRDPRLWLGIVLVAVSVVVGARWFAAADNTVAVWRATEPLHVGVPVTADMFEQAQVHFGSGQSAAYAVVADGAPSGQVLREVGAGELVPSKALGPAASPPLTTVSLELTAARVPTDLTPGSRVDLWVLPGTESDAKSTTQRLAHNVLVLEAPVTETLGGPTASRQVVVGLVAETPDADLITLMEAAAAGRVTVSGQSSP